MVCWKCKGDYVNDCTECPWCGAPKIEESSGNIFTDLGVLLPCPFCGSRKVEIVHCDEHCCGAQPIAMECECGLWLWITANSDDDAIKVWNKQCAVNLLIDASILLDDLAPNHVITEKIDKYLE